MSMVSGFGNGVDRKGSDVRSVRCQIENTPRSSRSGEIPPRQPDPRMVTRCMMRRPLIRKRPASRRGGLWGKGGQTEPLQLSSTHGQPAHGGWCASCISGDPTRSRGCCVPPRIFAGANRDWRTSHPEIAALGRLPLPLFAQTLR
ncbi:predicted protein [Chaetomium globosum CBS 148.51]|uniref:Uncharacterized protein n=1 Tax=Chaetomium globosum (strain ATCC 6205 / CBS 148.51 / DSM 1962 / NBRC 6347 / NRRL 1970) TaxID=306901 RepID=Q2GZH4_CHAGB|nr:uncharacterized protein CHGG_05072 [Chaetomium globosum CBS 148.51]EAQ88453.1 predicted protein [Chaetomium globosum CBS 148.51]